MKTKKGDVIAVVKFAKVERSSTGYVDATDIDVGEGFSIRGDSLIQKCLSADFFDSEERISRTEMAEILVSSNNTPLTVVFTKQNGEKRTLRGRLLGAEPLLGRSYVEDLDIDGENKKRLVDHRTLETLIVGGVKYTLKKK